MTIELSPKEKDSAVEIVGECLIALGYITDVRDPEAYNFLRAIKELDSDWVSLTVEMKEFILTEYVGLRTDHPTSKTHHL